MSKQNEYKKKINGKTYYINVFEWSFYTVVKVNGSYRHGYRQGTTYAISRELFCSDVDRLCAEMLNEAVQNREEHLENKREYHDRIQESLDIVKEEYE